MVDAKKCTKCNESKPISEFHRHILKSDGHRAVCKLCRMKPSTKERIELFSLGLRRCHKCREIKQLAEFSKGTTRCKVCLSKDQLHWRKNNQERVKRNRQEYRAKNRELIVAKDRQYYLKNSSRIIENVRLWRKNNPIKKKIQSETRRARERLAEGTFEESDVLYLYEKQNGLCIYCGENLSTSLTIDHIIPLSRNGSNWPSNIQLLCFSCNASKGDKTHDEYIEYLKIVSRYQATLHKK